MQEFGLLNWSIVGAYVVSTLIMGGLLSKKVKTDEHYYLGDKTTPWWAIGLSVVATYIGALTFLGGPAWAYQEGLSVILIHVNYPIAVFAAVLAEKPAVLWQVSSYSVISLTQASCFIPLLWCCSLLLV